MKAGDPGAGSHHFVEFRNVTVYKVVSSAATKENHCIRIFEKGVRIFGPVDGVAALDIALWVCFLKPISDQPTACGIFVLSEAVRGFVGHKAKDCLVITVSGDNQACYQEEQGKNGEAFFHAHNVAMLEGLGQEQDES